jgi:hypothetical protein
MTNQDVAEKNAEQEPLAQSVEQAVQGLRAVLFEVYAAVEADPSAPQKVSRRFGVTKSQAWKLSKVLSNTDPLEAARYLPGRRGLDRVLAALADHGLSANLRSRAQQAMDAFHLVINTHAGDRATLERTLDAMRADSDDPASMVSSRKLSFLGNSATWGIQARARVSIRVLVPGRDDSDHLDTANVSGLLDLRRLRSTACWTLEQYSCFAEEADASSPAEPLFPVADSASNAPFIPTFCSESLPPVRSVPIGSGVRFELSEGQLGKAAAISCLFGMRYRNFTPIRATGPDDSAVHAGLLRTPTEVSLMDLLVHRDLPFELPPIARLYSMMETDNPAVLAGSARFRLPLSERVESLGSYPPLLATPHHARHIELVDQVVQRMGCQLKDFAAWRIVLRYPPIPTMLCLEHPLLGS